MAIIDFVSLTSPSKNTECERRTDNAVKNRYWSALRSRQRKAKKEAKKRTIAAKAQEIEEEQWQQEAKKRKSSKTTNVQTVVASTSSAYEVSNIEQMLESNPALEASLVQEFETIPGTSSLAGGFIEELEDRKPSAKEKNSYSI